LGFEIGQSHSPIIPLITGEAETALRVAEHLLAHSFYAPAIRPPTVPQGQSRIRLSVTCAHTSTHIDRILETLALLRTTDKELWDRLTIPGVAARERRRGNRLPTL
jgi:7-keto-8-aminopelargonate synthetase-like enzyme